jgi:ATP-dependent DNA helicase RecQ
LRQKAVILSKEEFENIHSRILAVTKTETLTIKDLMIKLNGIKKEKAWKVMEFLQAENKIEMDESGWIRIK